MAKSLPNLIAEHSAEGIEIEPAACGQRPAEIFVADDHRVHKRGIAEDVIGVDVGVDQVADRFR